MTASAHCRCSREHDENAESIAVVGVGNRSASAPAIIRRRTAASAARVPAASARHTARGRASAAAFAAGTCIATGSCATIATTSTIATGCRAASSRIAAGSCCATIAAGAHALDTPLHDGLAFITGSALTVRRAARRALRPVTSISGNTHRLRPDDTHAHAVALRSACLIRSAAHAGSAFGTDCVFRACACTVALPILTTRGGWLRGTFAVWIGPILDWAARSIRTLTLFRRGTCLASAIAKRIATHAIHAEARSAFRGIGARRSWGSRRLTSARGADVPANAFIGVGARILACAARTHVWRAVLSHCVGHALSHAIADLAGDDRTLTGARATRGALCIKLTSACTVAGTRLSAASGCLLHAFVVEIVAQNNRAAYAIRAIALFRHRTRLAEPNARRVATDAVDAIARRALRSCHAHPAV